MKIPEKMNLKIILDVDCFLKSKYLVEKNSVKISGKLEAKRLNKIIKLTKKYFKKLNMYECEASIISDNDFFKEYVEEFSNDKK